MKPFRGATEMKLFGHGDETTKLAQLEHRYNS
jgi:hypothetical protein